MPQADLKRSAPVAAPAVPTLGAGPLHSEARTAATRRNLTRSRGPEAPHDGAIARYPRCWVAEGVPSTVTERRGM